MAVLHRFKLPGAVTFIYSIMFIIERRPAFFSIDEKSAGEALVHGIAFLVPEHWQCWKQTNKTANADGSAEGKPRRGAANAHLLSRSSFKGGFIFKAASLTPHWLMSLKRRALWRVISLAGPQRHCLRGRQPRSSPGKIANVSWDFQSGQNNMGLRRKEWMEGSNWLQPAF